MKMYGGYICRGANWDELSPQNAPGNGRMGIAAATGAAVGDIE